MALLGERFITRRRYDGSSWVAGRWSQAASADVSFLASVQVLRGRDREVRVEGIRLRADVVALTEVTGFVRASDQLTDVEADELIIDGETFKVVHRDRQHALIPHEMVYGVRQRERSTVAPAGILVETENALRSWIVATAVDGTLPTPDAQVIHANQEGPRPPLPYLVVDVTLFDQRIGTDTQRSNALGQVEVRGLRRGTLSVHAYGEGSVPWLERATTLLTGPAARAILDAAGLEVRAIGPLQDLTALTDVAQERRHQRDFEFQYARVPRTGEAEQATILTEVQTTDTWGSEPTDLVVNNTIDMTSP